MFGDFGSPAGGRVRAVLFDFFGTLTLGLRRGRAHATVAHVLGADPARFDTALTWTFFDRASGRYGDARQTMRELARLVGCEPSEEALTAATAARVEAVRADIRLRPDAVATLAALRNRHVRTAVVSDCTHELPVLFGGLPIAPYVQARVFSVLMGVCKPDPEMYAAACEALDVKPAECLYLGDGGSQELTGATESGMTAVRLAAPDLAGHLSYGGEPGWNGPAVRALSEVLALLD